jgi:PTH1 family peptidyl-tRNA hydrolase
VPGLLGRVIVGLGNPGRRYERTRHNAGFWVLDSLAHHWDFPLFVEEENYLVSEGGWERIPVNLVKPQTYMNNSGLALVEYQHRHPFDVPNLLVVSDELDLPVGSFRLREQGGSAGHRGIESIMTALEGRPFPRLRVGIGREDRREDGTTYVLSEFPPEEEDLVLDVLPTIIAAVECFCRDGIAEAMNRFNVRGESDRAT